MHAAIQKADFLIEALQTLRPLRERITVIKLGGSAMELATALRATLQDVVALAELGLRPVLVHGGGKAIDRAMAEAHLTPHKIEGRRVTDDATLAIVVRTLQNESASLVHQLRTLGGKALAIHSAPNQALHGEKLLLPGASGLIDLGHVGKVTRVEAEHLARLTHAGLIPVLPCLAHTAEGAWLNVNGDTAAAAVAGSLGADNLIFLSDTPGVLLDRHQPETLQSRLDHVACQDLMARGIIADGMIPKVEACLEGLRAGVGKTLLLDGRVPRALLLGMLAEVGVGTEIVLRPEPGT